MSIFLEYSGYSVELPDGATVVGRDIKCRLRFDDPSVSRRHVQLIRHGDEVTVEDLGSKNGTEINGEGIERSTLLRDRDVICIGDRELVFRIVDDNDDEVQSTRRIARIEDLGSIGTSRSSRPARATLEGIDRRRHLRRDVELRLIYTSSELEIEASTRNLSVSGVFVCTEVLEPSGTKCALTLLVEGRAPLQLQGTVRRVVDQSREGEPVGLGIEFRPLHDHERAWIELAMTHLANTMPVPTITRR